MKRKKPAAKRANTSAEDLCVLRQKFGLARCGKCDVCADAFFFEQVCDEVEGTYYERTRQ